MRLLWKQLTKDERWENAVQMGRGNGGCIRSPGQVYISAYGQLRMKRNPKAAAQHISKQSINHINHKPPKPFPQSTNHPNLPKKCTSPAPFPPSPPSPSPPPKAAPHPLPTIRKPLSPKHKSRPGALPRRLRSHHPAHRLPTILPTSRHLHDAYRNRYGPGCIWGVV